MHGKFIPVYWSNLWTGKPAGKQAALFFQPVCIVKLGMYRPGFVVYITLNHMDEIIGGIFGVIVIQTGRVVTWLLSFGKWRGELLFGDEGRIYGAAGALSFVRDGRRVITDTGLLFVGVAFYAVLLLAVIAFAAAI